MDVLSKLLENCNIDKEKILELPSLALAYIGDSIYDIYIRTYLIGKGEVKVNKLHKESTKYVKAEAQSKFIKKLMDKLSDEENEIVIRARNVKSASIPKNADIMDYRYATGFEALIGYLYLTSKHKRLIEILELSNK